LLQVEDLECIGNGSFRQQQRRLSTAEARSMCADLVRIYYAGSPYASPSVK
jgi:hypothetical protein